jgi:hypothetical protein
MKRMVRNRISRHATESCERTTDSQERFMKRMVRNRISRHATESCERTTDSQERFMKRMVRNRISRHATESCERTTDSQQQCIKFLRCQSCFISISRQRRINLHCIHMSNAVDPVSPVPVRPAHTIKSLQEICQQPQSAPSDIGKENCIARAEL